MNKTEIITRLNRLNSLIDNVEESRILTSNPKQGMTIILKGLDEETIKQLSILVHDFFSMKEDVYQEKLILEKNTLEKQLKELL